MLKHITRNGLVGFWFSAVAVVIASVITLGVSVGVSTSALLLTLSLVPPGIVWALWRGDPAPTVAEILYAANPRTEGRR
jgi:hypothetical protein